jgi:hypothetical protein
MQLVMKLPVVILFGLVITGLQKTATAGEISKLDIRSDLQVFYSSDALQGLVSDEQMNYFMHLDLTSVFPGTPLKGGLTLRNRTADTLWLAPPGKSIIDYAQLRFRASRDTLSAPHEIRISRVESVEVRHGVIRQGFSHGTFLPPHVSIEISITCAWEDLERLKPGIYDFAIFWSNMADSTFEERLYPIHYEARAIPFWIDKRPDTRLDTIYVLQMQSRRLFNQGLPDSALSLCNELLQTDSTDIWALKIATDAAWKLNRFERAAAYAGQAVSVLSNRLTVVDNTPFADEVRSFLQIMQERLNLIRRGETYRIIKKSFN